MRTRPIEDVINQHKSKYAAAKHSGTSSTQLDKLVKLGAVVDCDGQVWIKSKTRLAIKPAVNVFYC